MRLNRPALVLLVTGLLAAGCAVTHGTSRQGATALGKGQRILIMDPDVRLYVLTAGGLLEPQAEWTAAGQGYVATALTEELRAKALGTVRYEAPPDAERRHDHEQLLKLHDVVVGQALGGGQFLPTKKGRLEWSLGEDVQPLGRAQAAEYALFVVLRDSYASAGRHAASVAVAVLSLGTTSLSLGRQVGAASLVDLRTGDIVWMNQLVNQAGDLRTSDSARKAVRSLLGNLPK